jgi:hypothetical protein
MSTSQYPTTTTRGQAGRHAIFELAQVAAFVGAPESRVKNWTIGRPFRIRPTIREAAGTGRSNLYSREDLCLIALVNRLSEGGLAPPLIQDFLDYLEGFPDVRGHLREMTGVAIVVGEGGRLGGVQSWWAPKNRPAFLSKDPPPGVLGYFVINLRELWKQVDRRIRTLGERSKRGKRRRA